ncbi:hypothetical protein GCM10027160_41780 [Streptomyces calidiresistens]
MCRRETNNRGARPGPAGTAEARTARRNVPVTAITRFLPVSTVPTDPHGFPGPRAGPPVGPVGAGGIAGRRVGTDGHRCTTGRRGTAFPGTG